MENRLEFDWRTCTAEARWAALDGQCVCQRCCRSWTWLVRVRSDLRGTSGRYTPACGKLCLLTCNLLRHSLFKILLNACQISPSYFHTWKSYEHNWVYCGCGNLTGLNLPQKHTLPIRSAIKRGHSIMRKYYCIPLEWCLGQEVSLLRSWHSRPTFGVLLPEVFQAPCSAASRVFKERVRAEGNVRFGIQASILSATSLCKEAACPKALQHRNHRRTRWEVAEGKGCTLWELNVEHTGKAYWSDHWIERRRQRDEWELVSWFMLSGHIVIRFWFGACCEAWRGVTVDGKFSFFQVHF